MVDVVQMDDPFPLFGVVQFHFEQIEIHPEPIVSSTAIWVKVIGRVELLEGLVDCHLGWL